MKKQIKMFLLVGLLASGSLVSGYEAVVSGFLMGAGVLVARSLHESKTTLESLENCASFMVVYQDDELEVHNRHMTRYSRNEIIFPSLLAFAEHYAPALRAGKSLPKRILAKRLSDGSYQEITGIEREVLEEYCSNMPV